MNNNVDFNNQLQSVSVENYEYKESPVEEKLKGNGYIPAFISSLISIIFYGVIVYGSFVLLIDCIIYHEADAGDAIGWGFVFLLGFIMFAGIVQLISFILAIISERKYKKSNKEELSFTRKYLHVLNIINIYITIIFIVLLIILILLVGGLL